MPLSIKEQIHNVMNTTNSSKPNLKKDEDISHALHSDHMKRQSQEFFMKAINNDSKSLGNNEFICNIVDESQK
jgi:hypothetical protein